MRRDLSILDDLPTPDDWTTIERQAPGSPPVEPRQAPRRIIAAVTAFIVAVGAGTFLIVRFDRSAPLGEGPSPTPSSTAHVQTVGEEGTLLFPEVDPRPYRVLQAKVDEGGRAPTYDLQADALAKRFIETVMGWWPVPDVTLESVVGSRNGETIAHVTNPKSGAAARITLAQPVRTGDGGVWAVESVTTDGAAIDDQPGAIITEGSSVGAHIEVPHGQHAAWGFVVGSSEGGSSCFASGGDVVAGGSDVSIVPTVPADRTSGMDCGTEEGGYLWLATRGFRVHPGECSPLCGDSSPWGLVTIVPVLVALPENALAPGLSTYQAPSGWRLDYPHDWIISRDGSDVVLSNEKDPGPSAVRLAISRSDVALLDLADHDSSFPLDAADLAPGPNGDRSLEFQGNAVRYVATLTIGTQASRADVDRMNDVVASIRFPAIQEGEDTGGWHSLGKGGYQHGVGTPAFLSDTDLGYLVLAPKGAYALGPNIESCGEGENTTWDRNARQILFECPNGPDVRYELDGTPVAGNPPGYTTPLNVYRVVVAWDGTYLVTLSQPIAVDPNTYWG